MIHSDIMARSKKVAQDILNVSVNLRGVRAKVDYFERDSYLQSLVGEQGYVTFHPEVLTDILEPFKNMLHYGVQELRDIHYQSNAEVNRFKFYLADTLRDYVTTDNLLNNQVPKAVFDFIEVNYDPRHTESSVLKETRQYKSPKLSKLLVKLWGESHDIVKWYTCKCPKKLDKGLQEGWNVTLSILPHHIAGMSYYAPMNHGGDRWMEGYEGTSCMDTKRNSLGTGVFQLVPSLRDVTMAVAYLSYADDTDIWNPRFQARCLVRVVHINGQPHMIACRPYFISNEATHILIDGLKNKFGNVHFVKDMREYRGETDYVRFEVEFPDEIIYEVDREVRCEECDGDGYEGYDDDGDRIDCDHCRGEGTWRVSGEFLPYIDDGDFISVYSDRMVFSLPTAYFKTVGVDLEQETPQEAEEATVIEADFGEVEGRIAALFEEGAALTEPYVRFGRLMHQGVEVQMENAQVDVGILRELLGVNPPPQGFLRFTPEDAAHNAEMLRRMAVAE